MHMIPLVVTTAQALLNNYEADYWMKESSVRSTVTEGTTIGNNNYSKESAFGKYNVLGQEGSTIEIRDCIPDGRRLCVLCMYVPM